MAVITLDFHSKALKMCTLVTLVVPDSVRIKGIRFPLAGPSTCCTGFRRTLPPSCGYQARAVCACARSRAGYAYGRAQHVLRRD